LLFDNAAETVELDVIEKCWR